MPNVDSHFTAWEYATLLLMDFAMSLNTVKQDKFATKGPIADSEDVLPHAQRTKIAKPTNSATNKLTFSLNAMSSSVWTI
jgi:hypothetical protein